MVRTKSLKYDEFIIISLFLLNNFFLSLFSFMATWSTCALSCAERLKALRRVDWASTSWVLEVQQGQGRWMKISFWNVKRQSIIIDVVKEMYEHFNMQMTVRCYYVRTQLSPEHDDEGGMVRERRKRWKIRPFRVYEIVAPAQCHELSKWTCAVIGNIPFSHHILFHHITKGKLIPFQHR